MATQDNYFQVPGVEFDEGPCQTAGSFDPSTSLLDLPQGSLYQRTNGEIWKKHGPLPNEWSKLESGGNSNNYIDLISGSPPGNPGPSTVRLYASDIANRLFPTYKETEGRDILVQPMLGRHKVGIMNPASNGQRNLGIIGLGNPNPLGYYVYRNVMMTSYLNRMRRVGIKSYNGTGSFAGLYWISGEFTTGSSSNLGGFFWMLRFGITDPSPVQGARMFAGVTTVMPVSNYEPSSFSNCFGLAQLSTNSNNLYIVGGSWRPMQPIMLSDTDFPIYNTPYEFSIFSPSNVNPTIYWRLINLETKKTAEGMLSVDNFDLVPSNNTPLTTHVWRCNNTSSNLVQLDICSFYLETPE